MIVLFDGVCNLCNSLVQFIIQHDPVEKFKFASLQSEAGQHLLQEHGITQTGTDSLVLIRNNKAYTMSSAALYISRELTGLWKLCFIFIIVPKSMRDRVYNFVARNRYRWFGKRDACMLPTPELKKRFL